MRPVQSTEDIRFSCGEGVEQDVATISLIVPAEEVSSDSMHMEGMIDDVFARLAYTRVIVRVCDGDSGMGDA